MSKEFTLTHKEKLALSRTPRKFSKVKMSVLFETLITITVHILSFQMAVCVGAVLSDPKNQHLTNNFLTFLVNPMFCENVLKAIYFSCQVSKEFCEFLAQNKDLIPFLIMILQGKVCYQCWQLNFSKPRHQCHPNRDAKLKPIGLRVINLSANRGAPIFVVGQKSSPIAQFGRVVLALYVSYLFRSVCFLCTVVSESSVGIITSIIHIPRHCILPHHKNDFNISAFTDDRLYASVSIAGLHFLEWLR